MTGSFRNDMIFVARVSGRVLGRVSGQKELVESWLQMNESDAFPESTTWRCSTIALHQGSVAGVAAASDSSFVFDPP